MRSSFSVAILFTLSAVLLSTKSGAATCQDDLLAGEEPKARLTLQNLQLEEPEVEAKLRTSDPATFAEMAKLIGQELVIQTKTGKSVTYVVEFDKDHLYSDVYYDTEALDLFEVEALLRQRTRFDKLAGESEFTRRYSNFQAKNASSQSEGLNNAVFARNEYRGKKYASLKKFNQKSSELLSRETQDPAVRFARDLIQYKGEFIPVLAVEQKRFFMKIIEKNGPRRKIPAFYLSLDSVRFKGLVGKMGMAKDSLVELEFLDDLTEDRRSVVDGKIFILNRLTELLQARFGLTTAQDDKYITGVRSTVLF